MSDPIEFDLRGGVGCEVTWSADVVLLPAVVDEDRDQIRRFRNSFIFCLFFLVLL